MAFKHIYFNEQACNGCNTCVEVCMCDAFVANPEKGKGWKAFQTVNERIRKHLSDKVVWMRPSDIVTAYHDSGGWGFTDEL